MSDLATVANVKGYLAIANTNQDALIAKLIPRESRLIERWTGREFPSVVRESVRLNGSGTSRLTLSDNPILSVSYLSVDGVEVLASDGTSAGYLIGEDGATLYLIGGALFTRAFQNVVCSWLAGYQGEQTEFVPAGNTPTLTPDDGGRAVTVVGVSYANGSALTQVGATPAVAQFSFTDGVFTFAAADSGASVTMGYYYVPSDIEQACIELVGIDLAQRNNLGVNSKSLGGETVTYSDKGMNASVKELLNPFRRRAPS